jgi:ABC-type microcin C transport system duplicated ATPase subunit YejF
VNEPLLQVHELIKIYSRRSFLHRPTGAEVQALRGIDLAVPRGKTLAMVGESGSGKSTLARCIVRWDAPNSGQIIFDGVDLAHMSLQELKPFRRRMQLLMQGSSAAINPRFRVWEVVAEPLRVQKVGSRGQQKQLAIEAMEQVGLATSLEERFPEQLSGGQLQRLAIARALVLRPKFIALDEPFTGLDICIQAEIANLLLSLQAKFKLTYLFMLHDLPMAAVLADEIAVLRHGAIVESGAPSAVLKTPRHEYTQALVAAGVGASARSATGDEP